MIAIAMHILFGIILAATMQAKQPKKEVKVNNADVAQLVEQRFCKP